MLFNALFPVFSPPSKTPAYVDDSAMSALLGGGVKGRWRPRQPFSGKRWSLLRQDRAHVLRIEMLCFVTTQWTNGRRYINIVDRFPHRQLANGNYTRGAVPHTSPFQCQSQRKWCLVANCFFMPPSRIQSHTFEMASRTIEYLPRT